MIRMTLKKSFGQTGYTFTFEGQNLFDVILQSQQLSFPDVYKCGLCPSTKLYVRAYRTTDGNNYEYVKVVCATCRAQLTFGKAKKDGAFFLRKTEDGKALAWDPAPTKTAEDEDHG